MKSHKKSKKQARQLKRAQQLRLKMHIKWAKFTALASVLAASAVAVLLLWPQPTASFATNTDYPAKMRTAYSQVVASVHALEKRQHALHYQVVSSAELNKQLSLVELDAASGQYVSANHDIAALGQAVANWNLEISGGSTWVMAHDASVQSGINLPILLYHYPPPNFEQQLDHLAQAGYTTIDLDQAAAGMHGGPLPPKPVVITFDDGFAAQMSAFESLKRHNMKATFYIIDGGVASNWCIGAGRRYNDPLQPASGCGDAYMNWDQIRELDRSGLITIGGHTVNHRNLATLSDVDQRYEIITGKAILEEQLGHVVRHFAYPYGTYNPDSIAIAREAGYATAVTVQPGLVQGSGSEFTLSRVRDAMLLP